MPEVRCPGCGLQLPATGSAVDPGRLRASPECSELYGEVFARVMTDAVRLGRWHQTCVDAYAAQHVGSRTPLITTFFALSTLYLVLERDFTGQQGRQAHSYIATNFGPSDWPCLEGPTRRGEITVMDVALAGTAEELATGIHEWGQSVWHSWPGAHDQVRRTPDLMLTDWRRIG